MVSSVGPLWRAITHTSAKACGDGTVSICPGTSSTAAYNNPHRTNNLLDPFPTLQCQRKKSFICVPESEPTFPPMSLNPKTSDLRLQHGGRKTSSFPFVSMISLYYPFILISEWKRQLWSKKAFDHRPKRRKCGPGWWMTMLVDCWWMIGIWNYPWLNNVDDSDRRLGQINILIEPSPRGGGGAILTLSNTLKQGNFFKAACDLFMYDAFDHWYILMQRYL